MLQRALLLHHRQVALGDVQQPQRRPTMVRTLIDELARLMRAIGQFFAAGGPMS
jgi:hypothetical protein